MSLNIPLPDLRFEQAFMKTLRTYSTKPQLSETQLSHTNIEKLNQEIDVQEQKELDRPLEPITPWIVTYAVLKDQILMPLVQGFLFSGLILLSRPALRLVVQQGQRCGVYLSTILGLPPRGRVY